MDITTITGLNSLYVYYYNNKKYFLLGDQHIDRHVGSCTSPCDDFDDQWQPVYKRESCQSIGLLLHDWLLYNNDHGIVTDFYVEVGFTKQNDTASAIQLQNDHSWLQLFPVLRKSCFTVDKSDCMYSPNVRAHYVDIRRFDNQNVNPFNLAKLIATLDYHPPTTIKQVLMAKHDMVNIINNLINHSELILNGLINKQVENMIQTMKRYEPTCRLKVCKHYYAVYDNIKKYSVVRDGVLLFKAAAELQRLKQTNPVMGGMIDKFIAIRFKNINTIKRQWQKQLSILDQFDQTMTVPLLTYLLKTIMEGMNIDLLSIASIPMDCYLLSRLFLHDSDEVIVYTGSEHTQSYANFFKHILKTEATLAVPSIVNNQCLTIDGLPDVLPAATYRDYVINNY